MVRAKNNSGSAVMTIVEDVNFFPYLFVSRRSGLRCEAIFETEGLGE